MADQPTPWLPPGERWFAPSGGWARRPERSERGPSLPAQRDEDRRQQTVAAGSREPLRPAPAARAETRRQGLGLLFWLAGLFALAFLGYAWAHREGPVDNSPLPLPSERTVTDVSPEHPVTLNLDVGEQVRISLPGPATYSPVIEQSDPNQPVLEVVSGPGQAPELRADRLGHAVVEMMAQGPCTVVPTPSTSAGDGNVAAPPCQQERRFAGTLRITVGPFASP